MYYIVANEISLIGNLIDSNTIQLHSNWHISHLHLKITHHKGLHIFNFLIYFMISFHYCQLLSTNFQQNMIHSIL